MAFLFRIFLLWNNLKWWTSPWSEKGKISSGLDLSRSQKSLLAEAPSCIWWEMGCRGVPACDISLSYMLALLGLQQPPWSLLRSDCMPLWETRPIFYGSSGSNLDWAHVGTLVSSSLDPAQPLSWLLVSLSSWPACLHTGKYRLMASTSLVGSTVTKIPSFPKIPSSWLIWLDLWGATALATPLYFQNPAESSALPRELQLQLLPQNCQPACLPAKAEIEQHIMCCVPRPSEDSKDLRKQ